VSEGRNRREFFRVFGYAPCSYRRLDAPVAEDELHVHLLPEANLDTWHQLKVKRIDISGNGIYFDTAERFQCGDILKIHLFLEQVQTDIMVVYGKVVRVEEYPNHTSIAMHFVGMIPRVLDAVTAYVFYRERELIAEKRVGWL
jgi:c-di-GMP-binding flagellar brake protein YcgR